MPRVKKTTLQTRERQRRYRERQKEAGYVKGTLYAHPDDWVHIKAFAAALDDKRKKGSR